MNYNIDRQKNETVNVSDSLQKFVNTLRAVFK